LKRYAVPAIVLILAGFGVALYLVFSGPRMTVQPSVRAFERLAPLPPEGIVPAGAPEPPPLPDDSAKNPLEDTPANRARGAVYYQYYCTFCHGQQGDGHGPVGESYVPVPTDLRQPQVQAMSDGHLVRAMLTGTGHEPVLERVVPEQHRWYLVLYVRALGAKPPADQ
jgi:mono/diheme cytochrome c family protein